MDDFTLSVIVALAAAAAFAVVLALLWQANRKATAARIDLAQRRGLMFEERTASGGRAGRYVFTDTARGIVLEITRSRQGSGGNSNGGVALRLAQPRLQDGLAVWAAGLDAGVGAQMAQFTGMLETGLVQMLLRKVLGDDIAPHLPHLREIPQPQGSGAILLTNADPALLPATPTIATALAALPNKGGAQAFAVLGTGGLTLRLTKAVTDPAGIEAILDAGLTLHQALR